MIAFLKSLGFRESRQKGSHKFFRHPDGRTSTVPFHKGEDLGRGLTEKILKDADVTRDFLLDWLRKR
ncbi:MAG TPA: type II toxin-antitoxin system HicA family toxin [Blastocatellia bacterium]|nr:type II toxin-antitoxin system HicA family toxin [Blastocatellia bacterium]